MNCRPYGRKSTIAFWMLIAIADAAMLVVAAGLTVVLPVLAGIVLLAGGVVAIRRLARSRAPHARLTNPSRRLTPARVGPSRPAPTRMASARMASARSGSARVGRHTSTRPA